MGTRTMKLILVLAILLLALARFAWAEAPATEDPAPVAVAEATCAVTAQPCAVAPTCAVATASGVAPELLGVTQNAKGAVYYYDDRRWEAWVTVGANHGLRPNAQVQFMRCGKVIAQGVVKTVKASDAIVTPCDGTPAGAILLGDSVCVTCNGTRADLDVVMARERRAEAWGTIAVSAILAGTILIERYGWFDLN
jgi:hypothetical protein